MDVLRGSTGNFNSNFTTNALTTLPYSVAKQLTAVPNEIITRAIPCAGAICIYIYSTVHNMLVDDKIFCITFTFEWTF